jgi:Bacterial tandem repeat domain 1
VIERTTAWLNPCRGLGKDSHHGYRVGADPRYAAIWELREGPPWQARHGISAEVYQQTFDTLVAQGYRLVYVNGYSTPAGARFAAIWEQREGPSWQARHGLTATEFQQTSDQLAGEGYVHALVSGYHTGW